MSLYLGVDVGTTRTKVACYDSDQRRLITLRAADSAERPDPYGSGEGPVRDLTALIETVHRLLAETVADPAVRAAEIGGIAVGSMGEEVVLIDDSGRPVGPALCWYAGHGAAAYREAGVTAGRLDPTFSVFKFAWLARHRPADLERATAWTDVADYVAWTLLGDPSAPPALNRSHGSRTGLLDVRTGGLDLDIADRLGVTLPASPRVVDSGTVLGTTSGAGPLPAGVPVVAGGHDHFCGAFGSGVRRPGQAYVSAGTSEAQLVLTREVPPVGDDGPDLGIFVAGDLRYLHRGTPAGRYYRAWHSMLYDGVADEVLWDELEAVADATEPLDLDVAAGVGVLRDIPLDVRRSHLMASLIKGLAVQSELTSRRLEDESGADIDEVVVAGVAGTSPVWRRLRREATARTLKFVAEPEATVLGTALLAQLGVTGAADQPAVFVE